MRPTNALILTVLFATGCRLAIDRDPSDGGVDAGSSQGVDAGFLKVVAKVSGRVCSDPPAGATEFPVKVAILVDSSASMCVTDGPGSTRGGSGLCDMVGAELAKSGVTQPARVRALHALIDLLKARPEVSVALVPFDSGIGNAYPAAGFAPVADAALTTHIDSLQDELGSGSDYQGALAQVRARIDQDVQDTIASGQRVRLPRTKYVVILISDGTPFPRCTSDDADPDPSVYATAAAPAGIWKDNAGSFCNTGGTPPDAGNPECLGADCPGDAGVPVDPSLAGFVPGSDRNQNFQLFAAVDRILALKDQYRLRDVRVHSALVFNGNTIQLCGALCETDLFDGLPPADAHAIASWTLAAMSVQHGGGTFAEFTGGVVDLATFDVTSLASPFVSKALFLRNANAFPTALGPVWDSDGDGVTDAAEAAAGTLASSSDSDGDGLPDAFEIAHHAQGFDPVAPDIRGCKDIPGHPAVRSCRDADGDGLSDAMEVVLGTDPTLADTDGDGIPDGLEVLFGLDPRVANGPALDSDHDGVADLEELQRGSNPMVPDAATSGVQWQVSPSTQADGSTCYDFTASDIPLLSPGLAEPAPLAGTGANVLFLDFDQAPQTTHARDFGRWRRACVIARTSSAGAVLTVADKDFIHLEQIKPSPGALLPTDWETVCVGAK